MSYSKNLAKLSSLLQLPSPLSNVEVDWLPKSISLSLKRDDLIHPIISGNKWRKLKYQIAELPQSAHILSFGGPKSNHIHALAYCCGQLGIKLTLIIRGKHHKYTSETLQDAIGWGANIVYVTNEEYRLRHDSNYLLQLEKQHAADLVIPEGGTCVQALRGVAELLTEQTSNFDYCFTPVGSGGTLAGLALARSVKNIEGICVLKGASYLNREVEHLLENRTAANWTIHHQFHCGGYAKISTPLSMFCKDFENQTGIKVEPVYSGKMLFAIKQLVESGYFPQSASILALHTGGIQAAR